MLTIAITRLRCLSLCKIKLTNLSAVSEPWIWLTWKPSESAMSDALTGLIVCSQGASGNSQNHIQDLPAWQPGELCNKRLTVCFLASSTLQWWADTEHILLLANVCPGREPRSRCGQAAVDRGADATESGRESSALEKPTPRSRCRGRTDTAAFNQS